MGRDQTTATLEGYRQQWDEHGWCVIPAAVPAADLEAAQAAADDIFPSAEEMDSGVENERTTPWRATWDAKWPEFPYASAALNRLTVHPAVLEVAESFLGSSDLRLYMSLVTAKYANQPSGYNQLLHADFPNHSILVPQVEEAFPQLELFIYLSDVSEANGATRLVSRQRTSGVPVERHTLTFTDYADLYDDPGIASGPAGSIVAYQPDVYHRSVDWTEPGMRRVMMHVSYRLAAAEWGQYQAWAFKGFSPEWHNFVQASGPRELSLLGFPPPGHPYWDDESITRVNARYPALDMTPWRRALR